MPGFKELLKGGDALGLFKATSDVLLALLVIAIVGMMIVPLPTFLLDLLISLNLTISVVLLMVSIYVTDALRLASFPTILLISTLYRLALNVSSTRLILLQADAGEVIQSFGQFVVRGNFVVGAILFLILTLVQYIVIAKGSERVAEVAARFALDALPGKQMAIDADLRAGVTDKEEAHRRRVSLSRESQLYGSMDGAMKFVKGDAIAGIVITAINMAGGLIIGVVMRGMTAGHAFEVYALLTIGDGLVSQIPALLISTAAGLLVTRVASEDEGAHLGHDIGAQVLAHPKAIGLAAGLLFVLALVPGLPKVPFFLLAALTGLVAWSLLRRKPSVAAPSTQGTDLAWGVVPVALDLADDLFAWVGADSAQGGRFAKETIPDIRRTLYGELGVPLPPLRVRRRAGLGSGSYVLRLSEIPVAEGALPLGKRLAGEVPHRLELLGISGQAADLPQRGLGASWVEDREAAALARAGVPTWDTAGVLGLTVSAALRRCAGELIGIQEAQALLDELGRSHPVLVSEVVPKIVGPQLLSDVLRRLVAEGVSIRDLRAVLGALAEWGRTEKDPLLLTEYVRAALKRQITFQHTRGQKSLPVWLLDTTVEDAVHGAVVKTQTGSYLALEPDLLRDILQAVRLALGGREPGAPPAVLVTRMEIRRYVKRLIEVEHPEVAVLSHQELSPEVHLEPMGTIAVA